MRYYRPHHPDWCTTPTQEPHMNDNEPRPEAFWAVGNEVSIRSKVVEVEWDNIGRTYTYRLSGVDGWYDEGELTT